MSDQTIAPATAESTDTAGPATAVQTVTEATDTADPAESTPDTDTADTDAPEPIAVGTVLTHVGFNLVAVPHLVTAVDNLPDNVTAMGPNGQHSTVWLVDLDRDTSSENGARGWHREVSPGANVTALLIGLNRSLTNTADARNRATRELDKFRDNVREVALRYAREHDWCAVVAEALGELDINVDRDVTVSGTFSVTMSLPWGTDEPSRSDVLEALDTYDISIDDVEDSE